MEKRYIVLFLQALIIGLICGGTALSFRRYTKQPRLATQISISPENTVIVFDFHDVLVKRNYISIGTNYAKIAWNSPYRWELLKHPLSSHMRNELKQLKKDTGCGDFALEQVAQKYPELQYHLHDLIDMYNDYTMIPHMHEILTALKQHGFKLYLASNIGPYSYKITRNKYRDLFYVHEKNNTKLFDGAFMVGKQDRFGNEFTQKPKPSHTFFEKFLCYLQYKAVPSNTHIIFIDDLQENLDAAQRCSNRFETIRFTSHRQLRNALHSKGIMV